MSDSSPADASSQFRSIWVGMLVMLVFGILSALVVCQSSKDPLAVDPVTADRAGARTAALEQVREAQSSLVDSAAFVDKAAGTVRLPAEEAAQLILPQLSAKKATASQTVVPGSPTQLKQMQKPAETAPAAPEVEPKPEPAKPEPKPEPKPTATPAPAKPEPKPTATPAPAKPALKPTATPAPAKPATKPDAAKPAPAKPAPKPDATKPAAPEPAKPAAKPTTSKPAPEPAPKADPKPAAKPAPTSN